MGLGALFVVLLLFFLFVFCLITNIVWYILGNGNNFTTCWEMSVVCSPGISPSVKTNLIEVDGDKKIAVFEKEGAQSSSDYVGVG